MSVIPPTVTVSASPASISSGGSSVLTVAATGATQVTVAGTDGASYTLQATGGTQTVQPTATTTYTATAVGVGGSVSARAVVTVAAVVPPTVTLSANPASIASGGSSVLTVAAANATQVTLSGSDGSTYTLAPTGGTKTVSPTTTTTYTAVASGAGGNATATAMVTVVAAPMPTITLSANPATIMSGGSSTLTVTATNASSVTITGSDGTSYNTLPPTGGSQPVAPTATTTYTATATGSGGSASAKATVTVTPAPPTVTLSATPGSISSGGSSVLNASATNATQVVITGTDGSSYTLSATGGAQTVTPTATATYTATATGGGGTASAKATVTVAAANPTVTLSASPASITAGSSSTLSVAATNATTVTVTGTDGSSYTLPAAGGTQTVTPATTTTYTATASGASGNATARATVTVVAAAPTVTLSANPASIASGSSSTLNVAATNATQVTVTGTDGSSYSLPAAGGTQTVAPAATTTYTATATGGGGSASATATVTVTPAGSLQSVDHVVFMLQENRSFDTYFGMLNPYRAANGLSVGADGKTYSVDGIEDKLTTISNQNDEGAAFSPFKLTSTCVDDMTSSWLESYGDVSRYDFSSNRQIYMDGFVHTAENYGKYCAASNGTRCSGTFTETTGQRAMGYYDEGFLNYYYYMASQFALSDRWFSPVSSKSVPNRIATFTGGTTQGLVFDPGNDDHLSQLDILNIFQVLDQAKVSWKIYYTATQGGCLQPSNCPGGAAAQYPATDFGYLTYSYQYFYENPTGSACVAPAQPSSVVGDSSNSFCIDPTHIAPLSQYYTDLTNGALPSFAFIEAGFGANDEHPGSGQSILSGQQQVATVVNAFMASPEWKSSVFFLAYDEGGGPYDHVPPVPGHSNQNTDAMVGSEAVANIPDISTIAKNADGYYPCAPPTAGTPTLHCDLAPTDPGTTSTDAPAAQGFAAQLGFRVPNMVISPFTRKHYVSHIPMDHTAILKFVENRFISSSAHLTAHDDAQPNLLDFFDFAGAPWAAPPSPPTPVSAASLGHDPCTPQTIGP